MFISRIALKNWRNFRDVDVNLNRRMFIVGANASGKSNFLDAFRFLRDIVKPGGGLQSAIIGRGGLTKIRCLSARKDPEVSIEIEMSDVPEAESIWKYRLSIRQHPRGTRETFLTEEKIWKNGKLILNRPNNEDRDDPLRTSQTHLEQVNMNAQFRALASVLREIGYLHLVPQLLRYPQAFAGADIPDDPFGSGFLDKIGKTPEKTRNSRLKKIENILRGAVPQLREFNFHYDMGNPHLTATYQHWRPNAGKQDEEDFSDGTLRLIGLIWTLLEQRQLLLLEEPELSLHGAIIEKLPSMFSKAQKVKKSQIIATTHSDKILTDKGISLSEILILIPDSEGTRCQVASSLEDVQALLNAGFTPSEIVTPKTIPASNQQFLPGFDL
ncbi:MAG: AAA family ATPase [Thermoguttaceae bacterium]|nr:AAA family ATPase [Thermoguttaceae bacterium]